MIINLTENRRISSDSHQFTLEKLRQLKNRETGEIEDKWVAYSYYGTLKAALKRVPTQLLKESSANGITEVLRVLRTTERKLLEAMGEVG